MRNLVVLSAGLSTPSTTSKLADDLSAAVRAQVTARGEDLTITHVELKELLADLTAAYSNFGAPTPLLDAAKKALTDADGLIAVTPVFQASYSGLFKMFFDVLDRKALANLPTIIGATAGTARHSLILEHAVRPLMSYLGALVMPTAVFFATEDFGSEEGLGHDGRVRRAAQELSLHMVDTTTAVAGIAGTQTTSLNENEPQRRGATDPAQTFTPMSEMLKNFGGNEQP